MDRGGDDRAFKALDICIEITGATEEYGGEFYSTCPFCNDEDTLKERQFSFSLRGYHCFRGSCNVGGSIVELARYLTDGDESYRARPVVYREPKPVKPPAWTVCGEKKLLSRIWSGRDTIELWQSYKPLSEETIVRFGLGWGKLPRYHHETGEFMWDKRFRLMIPHLDRGGRLIGLYGRKLLSDDSMAPKWLPANGSAQSVIYGFEYCTGGRDLVITENRIDGLLLSQSEMFRGWDVLSLGTARKLRQEEIQSIRCLSPRAILVLLDNDLAGQGAGPLVDEQRREWLEKTAEKRVGKVGPVPGGNGFKIVGQLGGVGKSVRAFDWGLVPSAPLKADAGWLVENGVIE